MTEQSRAACQGLPCFVQMYTCWNSHKPTVSMCVYCTIREPTSTQHNLVTQTLVKVPSASCKYQSEPLTQAELFKMAPRVFGGNTKCPGYVGNNNGKMRYTQVHMHTNDRACVARSRRDDRCTDSRCKHVAILFCLQVVKEMGQQKGDGLWHQRHAENALVHDDGQMHCHS